MIGTIDLGQSRIKTLIFNDNLKRIGDPIIENTSPFGELEEKLASILTDNEAKNWAMLISNPILSGEEKKFLGPGNKDVINLSSLSKRLKKSIEVYNDAEMSGFALNNEQNFLTIREGNEVKNPISKSLIYLGTGFQISSLNYSQEKGLYLPSYSPMCLAKLSADFLELDIIEKIAKEVDVKKTELTFENLVSSTGLKTINKIILGKEQEVGEIVENMYLEVREIYSQMIGKTINNTLAYNLSSNGIFLGGSFSSILGNFLVNDTLCSQVQQEGLFGKAINNIPIKLVLDPYSGNKGAAYAMQNRIKTTSNIF